MTTTPGVDALLLRTLERLHIAMLRQRAPLATLLDVRSVDVDALQVISHLQPLSPTRLAAILGLSSGGTSAVIDRLVDAGLVVRNAQQQGRRRVALTGTRRARDALKARQALSQLEPATADVPAGPGDIDRLQRVLGGLADAAERHADQLTISATHPATRSGVEVLWG